MRYQSLDKYLDLSFRLYVLVIEQMYEKLAYASGKYVR